MVIDLLVCAFFFLIKTRGLRGPIGWLFSVVHLYEQAKVFPLEQNHGMRFFHILSSYLKYKELQVHIFHKLHGVIKPYLSNCDCFDCDVYFLRFLCLMGWEARVELDLPHRMKWKFVFIWSSLVLNWVVFQMGGQRLDLLTTIYMKIKWKRLIKLIPLWIRKKYFREFSLIIFVCTTDKRKDKLSYILYQF